MLLFCEGKTGKREEVGGKKQEKRIETNRIDLEIWDYKEFEDYVKQNKKKIYCLWCQVVDVPNNFSFRIFNPRITIQSQGILFDQNNSDLVIDERSVKSIEAHFSLDGSRLESFKLHTGKYGNIDIQLQ